MTGIKIASRYAKSLFVLCKEQGMLEEVHQDMQLIHGVCKGSRDLVNMLNSPIINHDKKRAALEQIFRRKIRSLTLRIINLVITKNRERFIPSIAEEFHNMYNAFKRIQKAKITTTIPLDEKIRTDIKALVQKYSAREMVELTEQVETELIGGFVLDIDDKRIDASVYNQLKLLKLLFVKQSRI